MYLYGFAHVIFFNWNADIDFNAWSRCISSLHTSSYVRLLALSNIASWLFYQYFNFPLHSRISVDLINRCDKLINLFC